MEIARHWRLKKQRYQLVGERCGHCDEAIFPPRDICPNCHGEAKIPLAFSGKGTIFSFTAITTPENAPAGYESQVPYAVALVKLEEGPMITAQITDIDWQKKPLVSILEQEKGWPKEEIPTTQYIPQIQIGMPVEMVTRKMREDGERGQIVYSYKFRPCVTTS